MRTPRRGTNVMLGVLFFSGLVITVTADDVIDPCKQHTVLDEPWRSLTSNETSNLQCDQSLKMGWYRFNHAEMLFDTCVDAYHCGTHIPMWINGSKPSVTDNVTILNACGKYDRDCCFYSREIGVKNCSTFLAYYLQPTPGCSMAYCLKVDRKCDENEFSATGYEPCQDKYPKLVREPFMAGPEIDGTDFKFTCFVPYPALYLDATFNVAWLSNGHVIKTVTLSGTERRAILYGEDLNGFMNANISCMVRTNFADGHSPFTSPAFQSNSYWAGIKITPENMTLNGTWQEVTLTSTVPVVCKTTSGDCKVEYAVSTDNGNVSLSECRLTLRPTNWINSTASTSMKVSTTPSFAPQTGGISHIQFKYTGHATGREWSHMQIPKYPVKTTQSGSGAMCVSAGDPHIFTFDNQKDNKHYDNFHVGQYVLVQRLSGTFRVETRTIALGKAAVNCGVAVREGNDVITLDQCDGEPGKAQLRMAVKSIGNVARKAEIVRSESGTEYVIKFPSGAVVKLDTLKYNIDVSVKLPGYFSGDTEGLCGRYDGNPGNDLKSPNGHVYAMERFPYAFIESWSIPKNQSLFEKDLTALEPEPHQHCVCYNSAEACHRTPPSIPDTKVMCPRCVDLPHPSPSPATTQSPITTSQPTTVVSVQPTPAPTPATAAGGGSLFKTTTPTTITTTSTITTATPTTVSFITLPTPEPYEFPNPQWNASNQTVPFQSKPDASRICWVMLNRFESARTCIQERYQLGIQDLMDMCVTDVELTGEPDMALSALNVMLDACQFGYMTNSSNYENGTYSPSPEYKKCPRDCSGNGNCVESRCECANGFEMEDCSVDTRIPPGFTGISGGPVCEAAADAEAEADCFRPVLIGSNMKPGETKCSVRSFTMDANGHKTFETKTTLYPADFLSAYQMMCHLPEVFFTGQALSGYMLSLTNNGGHTYSSETAYQVFNPECMTCDKAESCRIKDGTCMIDNTCFVAGEVEREDNLGTCQPMVNNTAWTKPATAGVITATSTPEPVALNNYTAVGVGCYCYFEPTSADCACCKNYGCPCAEEHKHVCFDCVDDTMCARQN